MGCGLRFNSLNRTEFFPKADVQIRSFEVRLVPEGDIHNYHIYVKALFFI